MHKQFGSGYADVVAHDQVLSAMDGRTALEALEAGVEPRDIWLAVCNQLEVPVKNRH